MRLRAARAIVGVCAELLITTVTTAIAPGLDGRPTAYTGKVLIHCEPNVLQRAAVDPLEYYGVSPAPHLHTPAGAMAFSSTSTLAKMLAAPTSCESRADHSLIWVPTPMTAAGQPATVTGIGYYLINVGHDVRRPPPDGLRFLAGDPHCTGQLCPAIYECVRRGGGLFVSHTIPTRADRCDTQDGRGYQMSVFSAGECWNGRSLGAGMGRSNPPALITSARRCRGVVIPEICSTSRSAPTGSAATCRVTSWPARRRARRAPRATLTSYSDGRTALRWVDRSPRSSEDAWT